MIIHILGLISKTGSTMGDLVASAVGCFGPTPGLRPVAMDGEGLDAESPTQADSRSPVLSIGIGAAIFLMIFIASEALAALAALRRLIHGAILSEPFSYLQ